MRWCCLALLLVCACGPKVDAEPGAHQGTSVASEGTTASTVASSSGSLPTMGGSSLPTTRGDATSGDATEITLTATTDTDGFCWSCEGRVIGPAVPVDEGFSAVDVASALDGVSLDLTWAIDAPPTTLTLGVTPPVGRVQDIAGEECCNPCAFIYAPCPGGLEFTTEISVSTADGLLAEVTTAQITARPDGELTNLGYGLRAEIPGDEIAGTLPQQALDGGPIQIRTLEIALYYRPVDGKWVALGTIHDGDTLLGSGGA